MTWASAKSVYFLLKTTDTDKMFEGDDSEKYPWLKNIFMDNGIMFPPTNTSNPTEHLQGGATAWPLTTAVQSEGFAPGTRSLALPSPIQSNISAEPTTCKVLCWAPHNKDVSGSDSALGQQPCGQRAVEQGGEEWLPLDKGKGNSHRMSDFLQGSAHLGSIVSWHIIAVRSEAMLSHSVLCNLSFSFWTYASFIPVFLQFKIWLWVSWF